ncbi:hypothetical protein VR44_02195 [Streptomyces katrae]|uniref:Uncharacterized protein n=1 Tax=Streptomyces katrae TaxID=68223 RepID=A0A0F4JXJ7_9ACTN|nr:hypothetical protein VR44_02195 [Streptomyces katrae]
MLMTAVSLRAPGAGTAGPPDPLLLASLLRSVATPADGLEHVAVRPRDGRVELVLFQTVSEGLEPPASGDIICRRALEITQQLSGWTVETER